MKIFLDFSKKLYIISEKGHTLHLTIQTFHIIFHFPTTPRQHVTLLIWEFFYEINKCKTIKIK